MNNIHKIFILIIILIIIRFFLFKTENFDSEPQKIDIPDVLYSQIINYKKYTEVDLNQLPNTNQIPKIIIQTWKSDYIPHKYVKEIQSLKNTNPNYTFIYFNDQDIENFCQQNIQNTIKYIKNYLLKFKK